MSENNSKYTAAYCDTCGRYMSFAQQEAIQEVSPTAPTTLGLSHQYGGSTTVSESVKEKGPADENIGEIPTVPSSLSAKSDYQPAWRTVMDLFFALKEIGGTPTLKDLVKLAKRIKTREESRNDIQTVEKDRDEFAKDRLNWKRLANEKGAEVKRLKAELAAKSDTTDYQCPCGAESSKGCSQTGCPAYLEETARADYSTNEAIQNKSNSKKPERHREGPDGYCTVCGSGNCQQYGELAESTRTATNVDILDEYRDRYPSEGDGGGYDWRFRAGRMAEEMAELRAKLSRPDTSVLEALVLRYGDALRKLSKGWLYWPSKRQNDPRVTQYDSRTLDEIEEMARVALSAQHIGEEK